MTRAQPDTREEFLAAALNDASKALYLVTRFAPESPMTQGDPVEQWSRVVLNIAQAISELRR